MGRFCGVVRKLSWVQSALLWSESVTLSEHPSWAKSLCVSRVLCSALLNFAVYFSGLLEDGWICGWMGCCD